MNSPTSLVATGVGYRTKAGSAGRWLVSGIDLTVRTGELLAIVGPNGAGKSTLLKLLSGDLAPSKGGVALDGVPLGELTGEALARRRAVLPQSSTIPFGFTAFEVVLLGRSPHPGTEAEQGRIAWEMMEKAGVQHLAHRSVDTLSGGELQRVHFARVLAQLDTGSQTGKLLFLDEPTSNLDLKYQKTVLRECRKLIRSDTRSDSCVGVVVVLHDLNLAAQYADRVGLMCEGELVGLGPVAEVLTGDRISAAFGVEVQVLDTEVGRVVISR